MTSESIYHALIDPTKRMSRVQWDQGEIILFWKSGKGKKVYLPILGDTSVNATVFSHIQFRFLVPGN